MAGLSGSLLVTSLMKSCEVGGTGLGGYISLEVIEAGRKAFIGEWLVRIDQLDCVVALWGLAVLYVLVDGLQRAACWDGKGEALLQCGSVMRQLGRRCCVRQE